MTASALRQDAVHGLVYGAAAGLAFYLIITVLADAQRIGEARWRAGMEQDSLSEAERVLHEAYLLR